MPSSNHELPLEMVRNRPQLAPTILRTVFGLGLPQDGQVTLASESFAGLNPAELRCDATVLLDDPKAPAHGIIVESQLRFKKQKTFTWPAYLALLRLLAVEHVADRLLIAGRWLLAVGLGRQNAGIAVVFKLRAVRQSLNGESEVRVILRGLGLFPVFG